MTNRNKQKRPEAHKANVKPKRKVTKMLRSEVSSAMAAYDRMLSDPCGCIPATAPYASTGSGYVVRTVANYQVTWSGATNLTPGKTTGNFFATWTPGAGQFLLGVSAQGTSQTLMTSITAPDWPLTATTTVRRFRPLAACIKYIPIGAYADRAGEIGAGYAAGQQVFGGQAWSVTTALNNCLQRCPTGSRPHEARWLPTNTDADFVVTSNTNAQGGCVFLAGLGVDGVHSNATSGGLSGYIECTTIWEWEPVQDNSAAASTLTQVPRPPAPFTLQDYLPKIKNIGAFVLDGIGALAQAAGGVPGQYIGAAASYATAYLTGGVKRIQSSRPSLYIT